MFPIDNKISGKVSLLALPSWHDHQHPEIMPIPNSRVQQGKYFYIQINTHNLHRSEHDRFTDEQQWYDSILSSHFLAGIKANSLQAPLFAHADDLAPATKLSSVDAKTLPYTCSFGFRADTRKISDILSADGTHPGGFWGFSCQSNPSYAAHANSYTRARHAAHILNPDPNMVSFSASIRKSRAGFGRKTGDNHAVRIWCFALVGAISARDAGCYQDSPGYEYESEYTVPIGLSQDFCVGFSQSRQCEASDGFREVYVREDLWRQMSMREKRAVTITLIHFIPRVNIKYHPRLTRSLHDVWQELVIRAARVTPIYDIQQQAAAPAIAQPTPVAPTPVPTANTILPVAIGCNRDAKPRRFQVSHNEHTNVLGLIREYQYSNQCWLAWRPYNARYDGKTPENIYIAWQNQSIDDYLIGWELFEACPVFTANKNINVVAVGCNRDEQPRRFQVSHDAHLDDMGLIREFNYASKSWGVWRAYNISNDGRTPLNIYATWQGQVVPDIAGWELFEPIIAPAPAVMNTPWFNSNKELA